MQSRFHRFPRPWVGTKHCPARTKRQGVHHAEEVLGQPEGITVLAIKVEAYGAGELAAFLLKGHLGNEMVYFVLLLGARTKQKDENQRYKKKPTHCFHLYRRNALRLQTGDFIISETQTLRLYMSYQFINSDSSGGFAIRPF